MFLSSVSYFSVAALLNVQYHQISMNPTNFFLLFLEELYSVKTNIIIIILK